MNWELKYSGKNADLLPPKVKEWVEAMAKWCEPDCVEVVTGTKEEENELYSMLEKNGVIKRLTKYENCWLARTNPKDVARVESKTVIASDDEHDTIATPKMGKRAQGGLGPWMSMQALDAALEERFPGCMRGRVMYVIPFSMGPIGSVFSKIGVQLTDSAFVVINMLIMARVGAEVLRAIQGDDFVECLHSVGQPLPSDRPIINHWPCNPEKTIIAHIPAQKKIASFGSGYGGNSLLGKKCLALRIGSTLAQKEGWLAEHMLIMGITNPQGVKRYICAAFPSACGKTNMAMMTSTLPGYKIEVVGDDIAWLRLDDKGQLRAVNPESGFFGVAPGTSNATNPIAMQTILKNTIFTNVAETSDGGVWWEGIDEEYGKGVDITDWLGDPWTPESGTPAAQPNSRFTTPAGQCPIIDPAWESPEGVPISAIVFGGRRPEGVPLVYEAYNWAHGVFIGASMKSEATAAAEFKGKAVMHDPMAMRPFMSYNFGYYLAHWLEMEMLAKGHPMPRVFHVNWFRKSAAGKFLWPGYGDNVRVLDWMLRRIDGEDIAVPSPIGYIPTPDSINLTDLQYPHLNMDTLLDIEKDFWLKETDELTSFFEKEVGCDLPSAVQKELDALKKRVREMNE